jgi:hypothetical protein
MLSHHRTAERCYLLLLVLPVEADLQVGDNIVVCNAHVLGKRGAFSLELELF